MIKARHVVREVLANLLMGFRPIKNRRVKRGRTTLEDIRRQGQQIIEEFYFFIDTMIRRFAPCRAAFDFEGSEIPDVEVFYQSFSPRTEYYYQYYLNRLPFPFRWLADLKFKP